MTQQILPLNSYQKIGSENIYRYSWGITIL